MHSTPPHPDPLPPIAAALKAAFADWAATHPEHAGDLPWAWLSDPDKLRELQHADRDVARIRQALERGAAPESLGLAGNGLAQVLEDRGLTL